MAHCPGRMIRVATVRQWGYKNGALKPGALLTAHQAHCCASLHFLIPFHLITPVLSIVKATYVAGEQVYERGFSEEDFRYPAAA
ncbi:hypothetical protein AWB69_03205 [Caballeronia udeis]|uniref:Uncharacterized protein n=1 Tax=Caballeronia udeis TaxID=1232866 RepID=A0A158GTT2_9BURK|nr:hypothetical protein AWB69_03205 [Caballeronia udeis]